MSRIRIITEPDKIVVAREYPYGDPMKNFLACLRPGSPALAIEKIAEFPKGFPACADAVAEAFGSALDVPIVWE